MPEWSRLSGIVSKAEASMCCTFVRGIWVLPLFVFDTILKKSQNHSGTLYVWYFDVHSFPFHFDTIFLSAFDTLLLRRNTQASLSFSTLHYDATRCLSGALNFCRSVNCYLAISIEVTREIVSKAEESKAKETPPPPKCHKHWQTNRQILKPTAIMDDKSFNF